MSDAETVLQHWEGHVTAVGPEGFTASLVDVTAGDVHESLEADIPWVSLPDGRPATVREGTYLRWRILASRDGASRSDFEFDIAGVFTEEDLARAKAKADELHAGLQACFAAGENAS